MRVRSSSTSAWTSSPLRANAENRPYRTSALSRSAIDGGVDARVLHLDGHLPAVPQHRAVDLTDARGGHRLRLPARKMRSGSSPSSCRTTSAARLGAIGGASDCSVASACWASSGSASMMKLSSWPIFISAPFIWPSSRATSSAVRMTKPASSSARRSSDAPTRRTWWAVQSAPRAARSGATPGPTARRGRGGGDRWRRWPRPPPRRRMPRRPPNRGPAPGGSPRARRAPRRYRCRGRRGPLRWRPPLGDGIGREQVVGQRFARHLVGPVGARIEAIESDLHVGQVPLDAVKIDRGADRGAGGWAGGRVVRLGRLGPRRRGGRGRWRGEAGHGRGSYAVSHACRRRLTYVVPSWQRCDSPTSPSSSGRSRRSTTSSLDIGDREFMVLLGPSGCGKTTLLRMIAGLEDPTDGDICIGEQRVNDVAPKERDVAMVFQSYALYPHKTVQANIEFPLKVRGVASTGAGGTRPSAPPSSSGSSELLDRKPGALSGGQRQRVALARAIVRHPAVFCMDEPLSNLDAKLRGETRAELIALHQRLEATFIYVTHDQVEAMTMGTRVAVMQRGVLQQVGTPQEVYDRPASLFVAQFLGTPPMNVFRPGLLEPGEHLVGVRPEHLRLDREGPLTARVRWSSTSATSGSSPASLPERGSSWWPARARWTVPARARQCSSTPSPRHRQHFDADDREAGRGVSRSTDAGGAAGLPVPVARRSSSSACSSSTRSDGRSGSASTAGDGFGGAEERTSVCSSTGDVFQSNEFQPRARRHLPVRAHHRADRPGARHRPRRARRQAPARDAASSARCSRRRSPRPSPWPR